MAKELPYFKFEPAQWENGNIQMCSFEAQGVFISVCSIYWQRLGDLPYKLAVQKICKGNAVALDSLIDEDILRVIDGHICIDFLNEQLSEFGSISKTNSDNAREGWKKRRLDAVALRTDSEGNAIREEKRREDERKKQPARFSDDFYTNASLAFDDLIQQQIYIEEECVRTVSMRGWRAVKPLDIAHLLKYFLTLKEVIDKPKKDVKQHFKNWLGAGTTQINELVKISEESQK